MAYRIAFASSDGKAIDEHFGRTKKFVIFEIDECNAEFIELRENKPAGQGFEDTDKAIKRTIDRISDCKAVFVTKIGYAALAVLQAKGIRAFEVPNFINEILAQIVSSTLKI